VRTEDVDERKRNEKRKMKKKEKKKREGVEMLNAAWA